MTVISKKSIKRYSIDTLELLRKEEFDIDDVTTLIYLAYRKLKSYAYYANDTLLKQTIITFESDLNINVELEGKHCFSEQLNTKLRNIAENVWGKLDCFEDLYNQHIERELHLMPKTSSQKEAESEKIDEYKIITNYGKHELMDKVTVFAKLPIEDHILGIIFVMFFGPHLEAERSRYCYSNKLSKSIFSDHLELFERYFEQYELWRDNAIKIVERHLDDKENVILVSLDIKDYFYNANIEISFFEDLKKLINSEFSIANNCNKSKFYNLVLRQVDYILSWYSKFFISENRGLPLGFIPSYIIGDSYLNPLDFSANETNDLLYYGRYVDDILIVTRKAKESVHSESNAKTIIEKLKFLQESEDSLKIKCIENLCIQKNKLKIYDFESTGSRAIIDNFKDEIEKNASIFNIFPFKSELIKTFDKSVFTLVYNDSINKIRSVEDYEISNYDLSKIVSQIIFLGRYDSDKLNGFEERIFSLLTNSNPIALNSYWEKIMVLLSCFNDKPISNLKRMIGILLRSIDLIDDEKAFKNRNFELGVPITRTKEAMRNMLYYSVSSVLALNGGSHLVVPHTQLPNSGKKVSNENLVKYLFRDNKNKTIKDAEIKIIVNMSEMKKMSGMIRDYYYPEPLLEYTNYYTRPDYHDEALINIFDDNHSYKKYRAFKCNKIKMMSVGLTSNTCKSDNKCSHNCLFELNPFTLDFSARRIGYHEIQLYDSNFKKVKLESLDDPKQTTFVYHKYIEFNKTHNLVGLLLNPERIAYLTFFDSKVDSGLSKNGISEFYKRGYASFTKEDRNSSIYNNVFVDQDDMLLSQKNAEINVLKVGTSTLDDIRIGLCNFKVEDNEFELALKKKPVRDSKRLEKIITLLNEAKLKDVNMLIFPEISIPFEWIELIAEYSSRNQIAVICGVEYVIAEDNTLKNYIATVLPYKYEGKFYSAIIKFREKNYYAPKEIEFITGYGMKIVEKNKPTYDLINWHGVQFAVYNCFELANILDRSLFTSHADIIISVNHNEDVYYYDSIAKSMPRDVHCYFIQVNDRAYGDIRISQPNDSRSINRMTLTGGNSNLLIIDDINIKKLREFQIKEYNLQIMDKSFKPVPPQFNRCNVLNRLGYPL